MKKFSFLIIFILIFSLSLPMASLASGTSDFPQLLYDGAEVLTEEERSSLSAYLQKLSEKTECKIAVATVYSTYNFSVKEYAEDYYHSAFADEDGILLLLSMEERDYYIYAVDSVYDVVDFDSVEDEMLPYLRENDYYEGFKAFADEAASQIDPEFNVLTNVFIALVIGLVTSFIIMTSMKSKLKSVKPKKSASDYVRPGSMVLTKDLDIYLYRNITRTRRQTESSSSRSGGGSRSGGRGGKF